MYSCIHLYRDYGVSRQHVYIALSFRLWFGILIRSHKWIWCLCCGNHSRICINSDCFWIIGFFYFHISIVCKFTVTDTIDGVRMWLLMINMQKDTSIRNTDHIFYELNSCVKRFSIFEGISSRMCIFWYEILIDRSSLSPSASVLYLSCPFLRKFLNRSTVRFCSAF